MRAVLQRVGRASVAVDGDVTGEIGRGLLILLGVGHGDTEEDADYLAGKCAGLRIFEDGHGKMNLSVGDVSGGVLVVSQFTLYGDTRKGRRPSFAQAATPDQANALYEYFAGQLRAQGLPVATGVFQAMMQVSLVNDGPVTIFIDTAKPVSAT